MKAITQTNHSVKKGRPRKASYVSLLRFLSVIVVMTSHCHLTIATEKPNIVMIFTDDQGVNDVGCYGSEIATPVVDQLAEEGMRFNQFYAASSICTPSRFGLLTGKYAHRSKDQLLNALMFLEKVDADRGIRPEEETYVNRLRQVGYRTALVGKWHLGHGHDKFMPTHHGFDSFFGHTGGCVDFFTLCYANIPDWYRNHEIVSTDGYATDVITDEAIEILESHASSSSKPLYLHLSYNAPHFGKGWDSKNQKPHNVMQPKPTDLEKVASITDPLRRAFAAKVIGLDKSIGQVLRKLDELDMRENTIVVFMTDHGGDPKYGGSNLPLRGNKATLYEGGIRVPCIVRWPNRIKAHSQSDVPSCAIDWMPTFGELTGYRYDDTDGCSLLPLLTKGHTETNHSRTLVWRTGAHRSLARKAWLAVRQGQWKMVIEPGKAPALFDLSDDPNETKDLSDKYPNEVRRLHSVANDDA